MEASWWWAAQSQLACPTAWLRKWTIRLRSTGWCWGSPALPRTLQPSKMLQGRISQSHNQLPEKPMRSGLRWGPFPWGCAGLLGYDDKFLFDCLSRKSFFLAVIGLTDDIKAVSVQSSRLSKFASGSGQIGPAFMASSLYSNDPKAVCDTHYFVYRKLSQVGVVAIQLNLKMLVLLVELAFEGCDQLVDEWVIVARVSSDAMKCWLWSEAARKLHQRSFSSSFSAARARNRVAVS